MPETVHLGSGKVRELYALGDDRLLLVASDRISTFDVVLPTEIPDKGRVLTGLSAFWFARTRHIVPNHVLAIRPDGRTLECVRLEMLPLELVVRGYLAGSGWTDYRATGTICGIRLPGACASRSGCPSRSSHPPRKLPRATISTSASAMPKRSAAVPDTETHVTRRLPCTDSPPRTRSSAGSCSPTRSSRWASTRTEP